MALLDSEITLTGGSGVEEAASIFSVGVAR
jgi:hypothetical protein